MLPTEETVKAFIKKFRETPAYKRKYLIHPFKCSAEYYKTFKNSRVNEYICREFIKGTCWHRNCRNLHDTILYKPEQLAKDVFGRVKAFGVLHDPHRTLLLTVIKQNDQPSKLSLSLKENDITYDKQPQDKLSDQQGLADDMQEGSISQSSKQQIQHTTLSPADLISALQSNFVLSPIQTVHKWRNNRFLIQFENQQQLEVAIEMLDGKSITFEDETFTLTTRRSGMDIV